jgi:hypothetical protein
MKDCIIGTITNYTVQQIAPWVLSLNESNFTGDRYMVCYNVSYETVNFLKQNNFSVKTFEDNGTCFYNKPTNNFHVCVNRFYDMWNFLKKLKGKYRYLISTDVGDVVFQSNPFTWLADNMGEYKLIAASESIKYCDEILWGAQNLRESFGNDVYDSVNGNIIYNAGTLAGDFNTLVDTFLVIWQMCQSYKTRNPDQAAYNVLLSLEPYRSITRFMNSEDAWACQLGTTMNPKSMPTFGPKLVEEKPIVDGNGIITTSTGVPFVIVHQYNRIESLSIMYQIKYCIL